VPGPAPTPTALKLLRGNPGQRRLRHGEPQPLLAPSADPPDVLTADQPEHPPDLRAVARAIWAELAPDLVAVGCLAQVDRRTLATACRLQALGESLLAVCESGDLIETTPTNGRQPVAEFRAALSALTEAQKILSRFGITPADRVRLAPAPPKDPESKWSGLLPRARARQ